MKESAVALTSPPLTHWELITVQSMLGYCSYWLHLGPCHADRSTYRDEFQLSVVRRLLQIHHKPCLQMMLGRPVI